MTVSMATTLLAHMLECVNSLLFGRFRYCIINNLIVISTILISAIVLCACLKVQFRLELSVWPLIPEPCKPIAASIAVIAAILMTLAWFVVFTYLVGNWRLDPLRWIWLLALLGGIAVIVALFHWSLALVS